MAAEPSADGRRMGHAARPMRFALPHVPRDSLLAGSPWRWPWSVWRIAAMFGLGVARYRFTTRPIRVTACVPKPLDPPCLRARPEFSGSTIGVVRW